MSTDEKLMDALYNDDDTSDNIADMMLTVKSRERVTAAGTPPASPSVSMVCATASAVCSTVRSAPLWQTGPSPVSVTGTTAS